MVRGAISSIEAGIDWPKLTLKRFHEITNRIRDIYALFRYSRFCPGASSGSAFHTVDAGPAWAYGSVSDPEQPQG